MKRETARDLLIPYLDGELDEQTAQLLRKHLAGDDAMRRELDQLREVCTAITDAESIEPDPAMRTAFDALLAAEKRRQDSEPEASPGFFQRMVAFPVFLRVATAAACVAAGLGVGWLLAVRHSTDQRETQATVASLQHDVSLLRSMLLDGGLSRRSASYRLQTMGLAAETAAPDPEIVKALFGVLSQDPNANVRLAAVEALSRFSDDPAIRKRLAAELNEQTDPFVQIALIGVLAKDAVPEDRAPLERLLVDPDVQPVVKGAAQKGLTRL